VKNAKHGCIHTNTHLYTVFVYTKAFREEMSLWCPVCNLHVYSSKPAIIIVSVAATKIYGILFIHISRLEMNGAMFKGLVPCAVQEELLIFVCAVSESSSSNIV
jgi:hypothetical protein